jgi:ABC-type polysaccharide/polyol phosphate export permease
LPFAELFDSRHVLAQLINQQLTLRYRRTALGYLWTLFNPLLMMSVMAIVFSALYKVELKAFAVFLFAGMVPWNYFNAVVTQSSSAFIHNEGLIKKIYIPKAVFPLSITVALLIALFVIMVVIGASLSWSLLFLPVCFVLMFVFSLGCALTISVATVFFRDLQYVITIALQGLFFLTPILYKPESLSGFVATFVELNPLTPYISLFRSILLDGQLPNTSTLAAAAVLSAASLLVGALVFLRNQKNIVFRL